MLLCSAVAGSTPRSALLENTLEADAEALDAVGLELGKIGISFVDEEVHHGARESAKAAKRTEEANAAAALRDWMHADAGGGGVGRAPSAAIASPSRACAVAFDGSS